MKKFKLFVAFLVIFPLIMVGCGDSTIGNANVTRDSEMTGGSLSFEYNKTAREIFFGGEGEAIQFYEADILKGWNESGNRLGLILQAPSEVDDFETGTLTLQGKTMTAGSFYRTVNGEKIGEVVLYPLVKENEREIEIKITWQDGTAEQVYKIIIKAGTILM